MSDPVIDPASSLTSHPATDYVGSSGVLSGDPTLFAKTMTRRLKAHTEAIAAQTQVAAAQHLPPLKHTLVKGSRLRKMD